MAPEFSGDNSSCHKQDWRLSIYSIISRNSGATTRINMLINLTNITFIKNKHPSQ